MVQFGKRLQAIRSAANLSQEQVHHATGISQSQIARTELGQLNTSISHVALYSELFGIGDHELLDYDAPIPDTEFLKRNVIKFLKKRDINPATFLKRHEGITQIIETKLLKTNFLNTPRFAREIGAYCLEKYEADFTTPQISKAMDNLQKKGVIVKLKTDKKTKFQYRKK